MADWKETLGKRMTKPQMIRVVGSAVAIAIICYIAFECGEPLFMASFGASAVIIFAMPKSPAARVQNVIGGHIVSGIVGLSLAMLVGSFWYTAAAAVAVSIFLMVVLDIVHPPGGATALITVTLAAPAWDFLLMPVAVGACIMFGVGYLTNMACKRLEEPPEA